MTVFADDSLIYCIQWYHIPFSTVTVVSRTHIELRYVIIIQTIWKAKPKENIFSESTVLQLQTL